MADKQITIRMPKELLAKWLAALRGGEYEQGTDLLECNGSLCCLGVLQEVADGEVERDVHSALALPTQTWLNRHEVSFLNANGGVNDSPHLPAFDCEAHVANDNRAPFPEIADAIEACAEGV